MKDLRKQLKSDVLEILEGDLNYLIGETKSPIEEIFLLSFLFNSHDFRVSSCHEINILNQKNKETNYKFYSETNWFNHKIYIYPQKIVDKYLTVDFEIFVPDKKISIAIECDGHEFHEKTKQQAQRDKQRDRKLVAKGYKVLRFSGSEIYNNPTKVISEIEDIFISLFMGE